MYKELFIKRLQKIRKRHGFTQNEVAKELNISQVNMSHYETGIREPDIETLAQLAEFYGVSTDWLIGYGEQPSKYSICALLSNVLFFCLCSIEAGVCRGFTAPARF